MSLERLVPDELKLNETTGLNTLQLHLERYWFAAQHLKAGRVLDIACGVGYGSYELIEKAGEGINELVAVDLSPESIALAMKRYAHPKIKFEVQNALAYASVDKFDTIVSLETLEHLTHPQVFIRNMLSLLNPGGRLVCSVPVTPSVDVNPYHLHDFTENTLRAMPKGYDVLEVAAFRQVQPFKVLDIVFRKEERVKELRKDLSAFYFRHPKSFIKRIATTLRNGFTNVYLTLVWEKR
jgi:2-polyprenyl-3-methyl-5-hydroxy-6-metoxy-1,4-benzoquinol methylase